MLHMQEHLPKKQHNSIQDCINWLQQSLLPNFSASAVRWPRYLDKSSLKVSVSVTGPHHNSRDKALKKTDRANRRLHCFSFSQSTVISHRLSSSSRYVTLPLSNMKIIFLLDPFGSGIFLNVYLWYATDWYCIHALLIYYLPDMLTSIPMYDWFWFF